MHCCEYYDFSTHCINYFSTAKRSKHVVINDKQSYLDLNALSAFKNGVTKNRFTASEARAIVMDSDSELDLHLSEKLKMTVKMMIAASAKNQSKRGKL